MNATRHWTRLTEGLKRINPLGNLDLPMRARKTVTAGWAIVPALTTLATVKITELVDLAQTGTPTGGTPAWEYLTAWTIVTALYPLIIKGILAASSLRTRHRQGATSPEQEDRSPDQRR